MGMMDYFVSSYNLGEQFTNVELQTKDIEDGIGGTLTTYWLDPKGVLWYPDYKGTNTFEVISEDDPRYNPKHLFLNYEWIPTGQKGKIRVCEITKYVTVYPSNWKGDYNEWPEVKLHFRRGVLQDYEHTTKSWSPSTT